MNYFSDNTKNCKDYYAFGSLMPGRSFNPSDYRFGFNGKEKDDEWTGVTGSHLDFGARIYDSRIGRWLAVDPLALKYPFLSPYNFVANSPIMFVDPDGRKIKGFSINNDGDVVLDNPSKDAVKTYSAMMQTKTGAEQFKSMVTSPTKITIDITDKVLYDDAGIAVHGNTDPRGGLKDGNYKKAKITISTAKTGDRLDVATNDEVINSVGTHESVHATDKEQIIKDMNNPGTWETERVPIETELSSRIQWSNKYTGNYDYLENYEKPSNTPDSGGNTKPSFKSSESISPPPERWEKSKGI